MPLYPGIYVKDVPTSTFHEWIEFSPFEIGMATYGAFLTSKEFGSKFFTGKLLRSMMNTRFIFCKVSGAALSLSCHHRFRWLVDIAVWPPRRSFGWRWKGIRSWKPRDAKVLRTTPSLLTLVNLATTATPQRATFLVDDQRDDTRTPDEIYEEMIEAMLLALSEEYGGEDSSLAAQHGNIPPITTETLEFMHCQEMLQLESIIDKLETYFVAFLKKMFEM